MYQVNTFRYMYFLRYATPYTCMYVFLEDVHFVCIPEESVYNAALFVSPPVFENTLRISIIGRLSRQQHVNTTALSSGWQLLWSMDCVTYGASKNRTESFSNYRKRRTRVIEQNKSLVYNDLRYHHGFLTTQWSVGVVHSFSL